MKRALIVAATGGFIKGFLIHDMQLLQRMGYEVHCAANADSVKTFVPSELFGAMGVTFHQIDFSSTSPLSKQSLVALKQYKDIYEKYKFDFVHVHTPIPGALVRLSTAKYRRKGCKVVYTTHGLAFPKGASFKTKLIYGGVEWLCSWLSDGIITINHQDYDQMRKFGCKKVFYINGVGVDTKRYHEVKIDRAEYRESIGLNPTDIAVLAVGELSPRKNHRVIIDALAELKDDRYVFVVVGKVMTDSGTYELLKKLAEDRNVRIIFLGFRSDIPEINHCADIAVLPSLREGLGLAGIEALASGVPVVGSNVQGICDYVVDGKTGYQCSPTDPKAFAEAIKILSNPDIRNKMKEDCINQAEEFRQEVSFKQMEDIYRAILLG